MSLPVKFRPILVDHMNECQQARIQDHIQPHQSPHVTILPLRQINQPTMHHQQAQEGEMDGKEEAGVDTGFEDGTDNVPEKATVG